MNAFISGIKVKKSTFSIKIAIKQFGIEQKLTNQIKQELEENNNTLKLERSSKYSTNREFAFLTGIFNITFEPKNILY